MADQGMPQWSLITDPQHTPTHPDLGGSRPILIVITSQGWLKQCGIHMLNALALHRLCSTSQQRASQYNKVSLVHQHKPQGKALHCFQQCNLSLVSNDSCHSNVQTSAVILLSHIWRHCPWIGNAYKSLDSLVGICSRILGHDTPTAALFTRCV